MDTHTDQVKRRIRAREAAKIVFDLVDWEDINRAEFVRRLRSLVFNAGQTDKVEASKSGYREAPVPLTRVGREPLPFGQYKGRSLKEVHQDDPDYLDWLCGETEDLLKTLHAFLKHPGLGR